MNTILEHPVTNTRTSEDTEHLSVITKMHLKILDFTIRQMKLEVIQDHLLFPAMLDSSSVIVDIGANKGNFSAAMVRRFGLTSYCLEPDQECFARIPADPRIRKFNLAAGDFNGEAEFFLSNNSEANSFNAALSSAWGVKEKVKVKVTRLGDFLLEQHIPKLDLLKIDAEGSEIEIFDSLPDADLTAISQVTVEFHEFMDDALLKPTLEVMKRMHRLGFLIVVSSTKYFSHVLFLNRRFHSQTPSFSFGYGLHQLIRKKG